MVAPRTHRDWVSEIGRNGIALKLSQRNEIGSRRNRLSLKARIRRVKVALGAAIGIELATALV
jgi:hypothetical protein